MPSYTIPPALRLTVEAIPIEYENRQMFLLRDRDELTTAQLALSPAGMMVASFFDGKRSMAQIAQRFAEMTKVTLPESDIASLVKQLSDSGFLETPEMGARKRQREEAFRALPTRAATHQGTVYPAEPMELAKRLGEYFRDPKGPGKTFVSPPHRARAPILLIAPHIDFARGGPAYAWAYQALSAAPPPDVIIGLGVAHMSPRTPWVTTRKEYETPYGAMRVERDVLREIEEVLDYDGQQDEIVHQAEHSLEFQAVWLRYLWREKTPPWVPILCSTFEQYAGAQLPSSVSRIDSMLESVGQHLAARVAAGQRITIVAGVDLAHVGPRFGDNLPLNAETEAKVEREDRKSLEAVRLADADAFYSSVIEDGHWRKVCGLSAIYTGLRWARTIAGNDALDGEIITYGQAPDPMGGIVSFTSGIFYQK